MHHTRLPKASTGDNVGFCVKGVEHSALKAGFVAGDSKNDPPKRTVSFKSNVIIMNHPKVINPGYTPVIDCHTAHIACKFEKFEAKLNPRDLSVEEKDPHEAKKGECILINIVPTKPMCVEKYEEYSALGRFAVRDMKRTVAVGIISSVEKAAK